MLQVDLGRLERQRHLRLDLEVAADDPLWSGSGMTLDGPLTLRLEAQQVGPDVMVRGEASGRAHASCRRCLAAVTLPVVAEISALFRAGVDAAEAEQEEVYPLPERARVLDVGPAVREQVVLSVPAYAVCGEDCRGLCPHCGRNRNEGTCDCEAAEAEDRWAPLRKLKFD